MERGLIERNQVDKAERVFLSGHFRKRLYCFAAFLICAALLVAAFALSAVWNGRLLGQEQSSEPPRETVGETIPPKPAAPPAVVIPVGSTPVRDADLSAATLGNGYINNETKYTPDTDWLLRQDVSSAVWKEPLVLILHTHTSESYSEGDMAYIEGAIGDATYSRDAQKNVIAVGAVLARTLNEKGVTAIHCTVTHDAPTLRDAYGRAEESIRFFLEQYPSIRYVIDLHRDSVLTADGEYLRAVTERDGERYAQIMAVVGSDGNGDTNDRWQGNLALAQQLRRLLNAEAPRVCRPTMLKNATYNQELAPYSLLLEIGTGACSVEEACRSAVLVGEMLASLICGTDKAPQVQ